MKTTQHTPGPWTCKPFLTPERDDDPMGVYAVEPVRTKLEAAYESDALIEKGFIDLDAVHAENRANARLIAAAPELLEACKHLTHYLEADADDEQEREDYAQAMAAIARALGKE